MLPGRPRSNLHCRKGYFYAQKYSWAVDGPGHSFQNHKTGSFRSKHVRTPAKRMSSESNTPSAIEQLVSRALRDNLERIQRTSDELHQAVADVVAACGSTKPANALPPMLRAQTSAASLSAALEVLTRFVAVSLQPGPRSPFEAEISRIASSMASPAAAEATPAPVSPKA